MIQVLSKGIKALDREFGRGVTYCFVEASHSWLPTNDRNILNVAIEMIKQRNEYASQPNPSILFGKPFELDELLVESELDQKIQGLRQKHIDEFVCETKGAPQIRAALIPSRL